MSEPGTTRWQPIETAPAQKILLLFAITFEENGIVKNWKMATGCKDHEGAWEWGGHRLHAWDHFPTHWMHLPEPPL